MTQQTEVRPVVLVLAGSDSGAGAGIQVDLLTLEANGVHGTTALTCLTAQNPEGVREVLPLTPAFVTAQARAVSDFFPIAAIKTGMLLNREIIAAVGAVLREHPGIPKVIDPVMVASSGALLLEEDAVNALIREVIPEATILTPNLDEIGVLHGERPKTVAGMESAGRALADRFQAAILLKGGHLEGDTLTDLLIEPGQGVTFRREHRRYPIDTHGSGCTLASAIAAHLARGSSLPDAVAAGYHFLQTAMEHPARLRDRDYIGHLTPRKDT